MGPPLGGFFFGVCMELYIYSDESGVFDKEHNPIFVFGGIMFFSKHEKDIAGRKYRSVERVIRKIENKSYGEEIKATTISRKNKNKIYRSLNRYEKFGVVIHERRIMNKIFDEKKSKQRYLDYAYKICLKRKFQDLITKNKVNPDDITAIHIFADEHTTATNGRYELQQSLEKEFKYGTFNFNYSKFFEPIFPNLSCIDVQYCNSEKIILIRAADIIANKLYRKVLINDEYSLLNHHNFKISYLP